MSPPYNLQVETDSGVIHGFLNSSAPDVRQFLGVPFALQEAAQGFTFLTIADEHIVFSNYSQRYSVGTLSPVPAMIGTNQYELNALFPQNSIVPYNITVAKFDAASNATFLYTAAATTKLRQAHSRTTYIYRYDGNFSNISPGNLSGAYHASELPLIFGTAGEFHGNSTEYENIVSRKLQDLWLGFAKDPHNGLQSVGWRSCAEGKAVLIGGIDMLIEEIDVSSLDSVCM